jgi:hypothetical protein
MKDNKKYYNIAMKNDYCTIFRNSETHNRKTIKEGVSKQVYNFSKERNIKINKQIKAKFYSLLIN